MLLSSLKPPYRGDHNEYTQHTIIHIKKKSPEIISNTMIYVAVGSFLLRIPERVPNSRGKRVIGVRATEAELYILVLAQNINKVRKSTGIPILFLFFNALI